MKKKTIKKKPLSVKALTKLHTDDMINELMYRVVEMDAFAFYAKQLADLADVINKRRKK